MEEIIRQALEKSKQLGASYADFRYVEKASELVKVKNSRVENISHHETSGFGVRVIADGAWGFASSSHIEEEEIERITKQAIAIAKASASINKEHVQLAPVQAYTAKYKTKYKINPFDVPVEDKIAFLLEADRRMKKEPSVKITTAVVGNWLEKKTFASTEGSYIEQEFILCGGGLSAKAIDSEDSQVRSYPAPFDGDFRMAGYEFIEGMNLLDHAPKVAEEAALLLAAPQCPKKQTSIILDSSQLALQIHESCGHPAELDRVMGTEAGFMGKSFLTLDKLNNNYRYGSELINITADATIEGGLGTFAFDDEGVPGQKAYIVKDGIFSGYLTSRETGVVVNELSNGTMRASGANRLPIIRMTNINLEPGDISFEEMIRETKEGFYLASNHSWSIDDLRYNFQFGTEMAYEIKDGSLGQLYKNAVYTDTTPEFWGSCDMIADKKSWHLWGIPCCGKGEPMQSMHVGHGCSPARFNNVKVGVGKWQ